MLVVVEFLREAHFTLPLEHPPKLAPQQRLYDIDLCLHLKCELLRPKHLKPTSLHPYIPTFHLDQLLTIAAKLTLNMNPKRPYLEAQVYH